MTHLSIGDVAPSFTLPRADGTPVALGDFAGKPVVVYFYPKDDTPGCTTEALDFTARIDDFAALGAQVIGISKDTAAKHGKFSAKHGLKVLLLSDAAGDTCETYGVWVEKSMYGKTYHGIARATFLIGADGKIAQIWPSVKVADHAAEVLTALRAIAP